MISGPAVRDNAAGQISTKYRGVSYMETAKELKRYSGILLPVSALPSPYGIGTLGEEARKWIDMLRKAGQHYWQVLPLGPTSYGDSPYQSFSAFAGNPYYIDLDMLVQEGLVPREYVECFTWCDDSSYVAYDKLYQSRFPVLRAAWAGSGYRTQASYQEFCRDNAYWLEDYALFMACKQHFGGKNWMDWEEGIRLRTPEALREYRKKLEREIDFWYFIQYVFFSQWRQLKAYAKQREIEIIGDIPIYAALDSADVWAHPELFQMDQEKKPVNVAGCPPDLFSEDGQLWGNPLYDWEYHEKTGFDWWKKRMKATSRLYDVIRIDHFIGIVRYYSIPYGDTDARGGWYTPGPGMKLIDAIHSVVPETKLIAEDLGVLTDEVKKVLKETGLPGMKVLEFAFGSGSDNEYLPHNYTSTNSVIYVGTHDNETAAGFLTGLSEEGRKEVLEYLGLDETVSLEGAVQAMIRLAMSSIAETAIIQAQDILSLGNEARMNFPSTTGSNWKWRLRLGQLTESELEWFSRCARLYRREDPYLVETEEDAPLEEVS